MSNKTVPLHVGDMVGDYKIVRNLGDSDMSRVFYAEHCVLRDKWPAVVKQLASLTYSVSFELEALNMLAIHPLAINVPKIYSYIKNDKVNCIIMEWIEGMVLPGDKQNFNNFEIVWMGIQISEILEMLHTLPHPIIHKDVKPANIIVKNGKIWLIDLGCSLNEGDRIPQPIGTIGFVAPELLQSGQSYVEPRMDIYSLGATLYYLTTGDTPDHDGAEKTLAKTDMPEVFKIAVAKALQHEPWHRQSSVSELKHELFEAQNNILTTST